MVLGIPRFSWDMYASEARGLTETPVYNAMEQANMRGTALGRLKLWQGQGWRQGALGAFGRGAGMAVGVQYKSLRETLQTTRSGGSFAKGGRVAGTRGIARTSFMGARALGGVGIGAGVGAMVYSATDNPLLGLGAGIGTAAYASKALGSKVGLMRAAMPIMTGYAVYEGFQEGGVTGAIGAGAKTVVEWGLMDLGIKAAGVAFPGVLSLGLRVGVVAAAGYGMYKGVAAIADLGYESMQSEFVGDTAAFMTQGAFNMRQRAMQEINRSHTNSRTILGNEAMLMHL